MARLDDLRNQLKQYERVVIAFSGGADSAFLAYVATQSLGRRNALCVTAVSPSLAPEEERTCAELATEWGLNWRSVYTNELANPKYTANDSMRCAHCKTALMDVLEPLAQTHSAVVLLGVNLDDLGDHRPGQQAAAERGAVFPLVTAGYTKAELREESRRLGLVTWDKPAAACLSSRLPYGTPVTIATLTSVAKAESALRKLGFKALRVRHYDDIARIEVPIDELDEVVKMRAEIVSCVKAAGYVYVTLDLEGLRSGNLNQAITA